MKKIQGVHDFKEFCSYVIPALYDDSLSYYELLCKFVETLNTVMNNNDLVQENVDKLNKAYQQLQDYVNNYFKNLDVQKEINNKLDAMAADGSLSAIIEPIFDPFKNEVDARFKVLEKRMDGFASLPDGSTSGDAELKDIRVSFDGKTYNTAGDAVRGQAKGNFDSIELLKTGKVKHTLDLQWEQGGLDNKGQPTTSDKFSHSRFITAAEMNGAKINTQFQLGVYVYSRYDYSYKTRRPNLPVGENNIPANYVTNDYVLRFEVSTAQKDSVIMTNVVQELATESDLVELQNKVKYSGLPDIIMPKETFLSPDIECNIYTENVIDKLDPTKYVVSWFIGRANFYDQFHECFRLTPKTAEDLDLKCIIYDKKTYEKAKEQLIKLHVKPKREESPKKVLFIGDSLTAAGYYPYFIQHKLSNGTVESVGTITNNPWVDGKPVYVKTEGRGGWSTDNYMKPHSVGNPFYNDTKKTFDFSYYVEKTKIEPDIVFINLGTNDVAQNRRDINNWKMMVNSIREWSQTIPICISLIPPAATQDGWTAGSHGGNVYKFTFLQNLLNKLLIEEFDGKHPNTYVCPLVFNLDREHDFPYADKAVSARNPHKVYRQENNVHPSIYGYWKFADVIWSMINALV